MSKTTQVVQTSATPTSPNTLESTAPSTAINIAEKQSELEALAKQVLQQAKTLGAHSAEVSVSMETGLSVSARNGEVETLEYQRDRGLGITIYWSNGSAGLKQGHSSTSDFSLKSIENSVQAACDIAQATQADEYAGLADAELMATEFPDLDLYHPWAITPDEAVELAVSIDNAARHFDARISNGDGASVDTGAGLSLWANSHGFIGVKAGTRHSLSCSVIAGTGDDMQRDYEYTSSRLPNQLMSAHEVGEQAAQHAIARLGARRIKTGQVPVLFQANVARGVIGHGLSAISGGSLYRDASFLKGQLDKPVFAENIHLLERPHLLQGNASSAFDADGLATPAERYLVESGILKTYLLSVYSARKMGMQPTAHAGGARNMLIPPTVQKNLAELLKDMGTGFLVTELMGQGVNTVTGDYSRGVAGFWIENGEIAYPVKEATIAGKLQDMYQNIAAVGNDIDTRGNLQMGSMLIEGLTVAGDG